MFIVAPVANTYAYTPLFEKIIKRVNVARRRKEMRMNERTTNRNFPDAGALISCASVDVGSGALSLKRSSPGGKKTE
jgi:hypothetical protein